jgi:hypothetical protein
MPGSAAPSLAGAGTVVFLGPSLDPARARQLLPGATYLPPICQGQLLSAVERLDPPVVGIVDGEFGQNLSVWHKEILHVLGNGVRVLGASSMGALRAAECDVYGMEGVGRIYEWFRDEVLVDDDEVALLHGAADEDWRNLTLPMVNIRATVARLRANGALDDRTADLILSVAKSLYFGSRTDAALASELTAAGRRDGAELASLVQTNYVDQKRDDAEELLVRMGGDLGPAPREQRPPRVRLSWLGEALRTCDTEVQRSTGPVLRQRIVNDAAINEADFEAVHERALHRMIVSRYAEELGYEPSDDDVAAERSYFLAARKLTEETLEAWLVSNDCQPDRFEELLRDEARTRRMRKWFLGTLGFERSTGPVTDQLRLEGRYPEVADRAARRASMAPASDVSLPTEPASISRLIGEQMAATGWAPSKPLPDWIGEFFGAPPELLLLLADQKEARREAARRRARSEEALAAMLDDES